MHARNWKLGVFRALDLIVVMVMILSSPLTVLAAGGSYTINFAAADPADYIPPVPYPATVTPIVGRGNGDMQIPSAWFTMPGGADTKVESLTPDDMALGQVVPFEIRITVTGSTAPENGVITFVAGWNIDTTSNDPFGYDPAYGVIAAFVDTGDGSFIDPEGDATVSGYTWAVVGDEIQGTFTVSGLDQGDMVVLEAWLVLDETIPAKATGNVPSRLISAQTAAGDGISTGKQTVPLLQVSSFFSTAVDVSVTKSDSPDPVTAGQQLSYTLVVANGGPNIANGVMVTDTLDPNTSFVSATASDPLATCTHAAGVVTCDLGAVVPGAPVSITITVLVATTAPTAGTVSTGACTVGQIGVDLCNRVGVTTISGDTNTTNNSDSEPTNVTPAPAPSLTLLKEIGKSATGSWSSSINVTAGDPVYYQFTITNTGDVPLSPVSVSDLKVSTSTCTFTNPLAAGATTTCVVGPVTAVEGTVTNTATASGGFGGQTYNSGPSTATYTAGAVPAPSISIAKTTNGSDGPTILVGGAVTWTYVVTNTGNVALTNVSVSDDQLGAVTCPETELAMAESMTCTATGTAVAGAYSNIGTATGKYGTITVTDSDPSSYFGAAPAIEIQKTPDPQTVVYGETATFTIVVTNTGNVSLTGVAVTDPLAPNCDVTIGDLAAGASDTYTCTLENVTAGFTNTATATGMFGDKEYSDSDTADVTVDIMPDITVTKTASPTSVPETGGNVNFTYTVTNNSTETAEITVLSDNKFGTLAGDADCKVGTMLAAKASCSFEATFAVPAGDFPGSHVNTFTATVKDTQGNTDTATEDETVTYTDVMPAVTVTKTANMTEVPETGGSVTYTFTVKNDSDEAATITVLSDDKFGALVGDADCEVGTILAGGASCSFEATFIVPAGNAGGTHVNVFTATVTDGDGNDASDTDDATVTYTDVKPTVDLTKTADPLTRAEPGGVFTYTLTIKNTSLETVTIAALTDDNDLSDECLALINTSIPAGEEVFCTYEVAHTDPGTFPNTASVTVADNDGNEASDDAMASVTVTDVPPTVDLTKDVVPVTYSEPGGEFKFTLTITNTSFEQVTITALTDDNALPAECTDLIGDTLAPDASVSCTYTVTYTDAGNHENTATVTVTDNDDSTASDSDTETVTVTDVTPTVDLTKTVDVAELPEYGGPFTFTLTIKNTSVEPVTITALTDDNALSQQCLDLVGESIPAGGELACTYTVTHNDAGSYENTASVTVKDNENNEASDFDTVTVTVTDTAPAITITKTASPASLPETGGDVIFTFVVTNTGKEDATLTSLTDTVFGDLNGQGDCVTGGLIAAGESYTCSITRFLASDSLTDHYNVVTAVVTDDEGTSGTDTDDETVTFADVAPAVTITKTADPTSVPETGGDVTFTFVVTNTGKEDATLTTLTDTVFGNLNGQGDCMIPQEILIGGSYSCSVTVNLSADDLKAHDNVATATVVDDDDTPDSDDDDETVTFEDVLPDITVSKTASLTSVPETGANVTFTFVVTNNSLEAATITSLTDSVFGALAGDDDCKVGTVLAADASCEFAITQWVEGNYSGDPHQNTFTAVVKDNENNEATATEDETVTFIDVLPDITITKTASPTSVLETGEDVTFTIVVTNNSLEDATIDSLVDSVFDLAAQCPGAVGMVLGYQQTYTCTFTELVAGDFGLNHENTATVEASDDDGNTDTASDDETVTFTDVLPDISVTKTANQQQVFAPGEDVTFTFTVKNNGLEAATITSLFDTVFTALTGDDDCNVGTMLAAGESCTFAHTANITADHTNSFTAVAADNDGNSDEASATATVDVINPSIAIDKVTVDGTYEGDALNILTGETITWKYIVTNNGDVPLSNITVTDDKLGAVCTIESLAAGASTTCNKTGTAITGSYSNTGTVAVTYTDLDDDTAARSDTDGSAYFGAKPGINIVKVTVGSDGTEGDNVMVVLNGPVTWEYTVTNTGNVALNGVTVTDDKIGEVTCPKTALDAGESMTCTATGTSAVTAGTWYNNTGTASGSYTDSGGHIGTATDSDTSAYYSSNPGAVTNSQLCDFGEQFRLVFTPDKQRYTSATPYYKLSDSNPGQFFYNLFQTNGGSVDTYTLEIPYPFVTQGANPVHVYGGLTVDPYNSGTPSPDNLMNCYVPTNTLASYGSIITLASYTDTNGDGKIGYGDVYMVNVPAEDGFQYINIHLDYGLEKTNGWLKKGSNVTGDGSVNPAVAGKVINDHTAHIFKAYADGALIPGTTDTIYNLNEFKQVRGFGGLVYQMTGVDADGNPIYAAYEGAKVEVRKKDTSTLLGEMITDADGWYLSTFVHKGKATTYTLTLVGTAQYPAQTIEVTVGGNVKYGEGNFFIPPLP